MSIDSKGRETLVFYTLVSEMGVEPKIEVSQNGWFINNGSKPYEEMDDLGGKSHIFGSTPKCPNGIDLILNYGTDIT